MENLEKHDKDKIEKDYLQYIGKLVYTMREKRQIRQADLAECIGVSRTALSSYENGEKPMPVRLLPLISLYCDFPMKRFTEWEDEQRIKKAFEKLTEVTAERYRRKRSKALVTGTETCLVAKVFLVDGVEEVRRVEPPREKPVSKKELIRSGEYDISDDPMDADSFCEYIRAMDKTEQLCAFMDYVDVCRPKQSLLEDMAVSLVDELIVNPLITDEGNICARKAYAFYRKILVKKENTSGM